MFEEKRELDLESRIQYRLEEDTCEMDRAKPLQHFLFKRDDYDRRAEHAKDNASWYERMNYVGMTSMYNNQFIVFNELFQFYKKRVEVYQEK